MKEKDFSKETVSASKIQIAIFFTIYIVLFLFLVYSEYLNAVFNHKYDSMGLSMVDRIKFAFKPSVMVIYVIFTTLLYLLVRKFLKPLFTYLKDGSGYDEARTAAVRMPWIIILFQVGVWIVGTTAYYIAKNWVAESGIHYFFGITTKVSVGFIGALYVAFIINIIVKEAKQQLKIIDIREHENDIFSKIKDHLSVISSAIFVFTYGMYITYYFAGRGDSVTMAQFLMEVTPAGITILIIAVVPIYLSKHEYHFQVKTLLREMKNLASDSGNLSDHIYIINFDELGVMAASVNLVMSKFMSLMENIQNTVEKLAENSVTLASAAQESTASSNQQAAAVAEVVSTMEDSDRLSKNIGEKTVNVEEKSMKTLKAVEDGVWTVNKYIETMGAVKNANEETIDFIRSLNQDVKAIWDVITIINSIADQVKIIAFNAELEASAAGAAGKNFEIVATEIRRLADNTMDSTAEIRNKIGIIEKGSNALIDASEKSTELIESGWELSTKTEEVFQSIKGSSEEASTAAHEISETIKLQIHGFEQILLTMKQISEGANSFAESTRASSSIAGDLKGLVSSLQNFTKSV